MNKQTTMPRTPAARTYQRRLRRALDDLLDVMEQTWGFRPCVSVTVEPALVVQANFEIEGFEHKGQRTWLTAQSACGRRTPRKVARQIAAEISGHRNTCKECGTGIPPIWQRAHGWSYGSHEPHVMDTPPDQVEQALHPRLSARLRARLKATQQEQEAQRRIECPRLQRAV